MRSLIRSNAHTQISGLIYSKVAELLFIGLLLVFIYPFASLISGVDPTVPIEGQSQNKIVYYLQVAFPFFCLRIALLYPGSGICLLAITMIYPIFCLASTAWSVNPYHTFKEASVLLGYILAIAALCQILDIGVFCRTQSVTRECRVYPGSLSLSRPSRVISDPLKAEPFKLLQLFLGTVVRTVAWGRWLLLRAW
jgi:hypothetical protein